MKKWLLSAILVVVAFWLGYILSKPLSFGPGGPSRANAAFLVHVFADGGSCKAVVGPKGDNAFEEGNAKWDLLNDCAGQTVSTWEVTNFRRKGNEDCAQNAEHGNPEDSPLEPMQAGPGNSKHAKVKRGAAHGQPSLPYCYDVNVTVGSRTIKADPEIDIMP